MPLHPLNMFSLRRGFIRLVLLTLGLASSGVSADETRPAVTVDLLRRRALYQQSSATTLKAFHQFKFTNQVEASGIRFEHHSVDDAGRTYQAAHYDHGSGVAAADVDGDGRPDLFFTSQLGRNELWRNLGGGRFQDITTPSGLALENPISVGAAFADYDNNGTPDLFVTTVRHGNHLYQNLGDGRFKDVTVEAGVAYSGHSSGAIFFDYDNDGLLDLFVTQVGVYTRNEVGPGGYFLALPDAFSGHLFPERTEYARLYHNLGRGRFEEVSTALNVRDGSWAGDVTFSDLNGDRYPDLYLPNMQGDDHYYENQQGRSFRDRTADLFPKTPWGSTGAQFFDFNQDGRMDLLVTDMHSDMTQLQTQDSLGMRPLNEKKKSEAYCSQQWTEEYLQGSTNNLFGNALFLNRGEGAFQEVSDAVGAETYWPWGSSVGDLNADGFEDVVITAGMGFPFRYAVNSVLLNEAGRRFYDAEFLLGVEPRLGPLGKVWFTLDCSGADRTNAQCAGKTGPVPVYGSLSSRSSVLLDVDDDGDLDLVTLELNDRPQFLISDLTARKSVRYLKVKLVGTRSNRDGLGARVEVRAGGRRWGRYHDGKTGYLGQSSLPLYFGLGEAGSVESVEVTWPSGQRQTVERPTINRLLVIEEAGGSPPK